MGSRVGLPILFSACKGVVHRLPRILRCIVLNIRRINGVWRVMPLRFSAVVPASLLRAPSLAFCLQRCVLRIRRKRLYRPL